MTDDLISRARAHADLHPESATIIGELLDPPRCETCKHWCAATGQMWGTCSREGAAGALMEADGPVPATLDTDPAFGCTEHEPKDTA